MPEWIDFTPQLENQNFCNRIWCWPCHCGVAMTNACVNCDMNSFCTIVWCCPFRTLCAWCPVASEQLDEPKEYTYQNIARTE